jgi:hypothetical protein
MRDLGVRDRAVTVKSQTSWLTIGCAVVGIGTIVIFTIVAIVHALARG